jgi:hypothetical protein
MGLLDGPFGWVFGLVKECTKGRNGPLFHRPIEWAIWIRQITKGIEWAITNTTTYSQTFACVTVNFVCLNFIVCSLGHVDQDGHWEPQTQFDRSVHH